jgi:hypothetical protein
MWVRKDAAEIAAVERQKRLKRLNPTVPLLLTICGAFVDWLARRGTAEPFLLAPRPFLWWFIVVFGIIYLAWITRSPFLIRPSPGSVRKKPNMICTQCQTVQLDKESHLCTCGAPLEPLDHWRWVDRTKAVEQGNTSRGRKG